MEISERIARAGLAKDILDNVIYQESYQIIRQEILDQWQNSPARDVEGREKLWIMLTMMDKIQATMQRVMETGKLAQLELGYQRSQQEKKAEYLGL